MDRRPYMYIYATEQNKRTIYIFSNIFKRGRTNQECHFARFKAI